MWQILSPQIIKTTQIKLKCPGDDSIRLDSMEMVIHGQDNSKHDKYRLSDDKQMLVVRMITQYGKYHLHT